MPILSRIAHQDPTASFCRLLLVAGFIYLSINVPVRADTPTTHDFQIAPQALASALVEFSKQADVQVLGATDAIQTLRTPGVVGHFTEEQALEHLLRGTELGFRWTGQHTVTIAPRIGLQPAVSSRNAGTDDSSIRSAQAILTPPQSAEAKSVAPSQASNSGTPDLTEIIVTAQKKTERLQDVPIPVTVLSPQALVDANELRLQDYYTSVPGLTVTPAAESSLYLSIRGVTTGGSTNPTVGVTVDDVPYGASTANGGGAVVPDLDPGDLARVEVLRGPQGTLYGASSMGGLLKFVTVDPSTDGFSGRVQAGTSSVYNGAEPGYNFRASVNIPLSDTLAIRASGFTRQDPGYIDNPVLGIDGINEEHVSGGRLAALWRPSEAFSVKLSALYQDTKGDGSNDVNQAVNGYVGPPLGDLQQNYLPGIGGYDRQIQAYSATLTGKVGNFDLTALSGYNINSFKDSLDLTYALGQCCTLPLFGLLGTPEFEDNRTQKFIQEVRLSTPIGSRVDWLLGGFYTHESSTYVQTLRGENAITGALIGDPDNTSFPSSYQEYAAFTDFTLHVVDRLDVQIGGRESHISQSSTLSEAGPYVMSFYGVPSPYIQPEVYARANAFTYLVTPQFKVSPDLMVYARLASGYRAGGPNAAAGEPSQYNPDKTQNYEVGLKGELLDHRLSVDASVYYIDWKDIQLYLLDPQNFEGYNANAGGAKSQGVELSLESKPLQGLTMAAWVSWDDAVLTKGFPPASTAVGGGYGVAGERLPYSSRFSGNVSLRQEFPLMSRVIGFVGGEVSYVGDREGIFTPTPQRQGLPAYAKTDLNAGAKYDSWTANLFVTNLADRRGLLNGGLGYFPPFGFSYIQPRAVGISFTRTF